LSRFPYGKLFAPARLARAPQSLQFVLQPKTGYFEIIDLFMAILRQSNGRPGAQQQLRQRSASGSELFSGKAGLTRI